MKLATSLSILIALAIASTSASPALEIRGGGRSDGVSCTSSKQCKSQNCHFEKPKDRE